MDQKDRDILDILQRDGRASFTDIAEQLDVSEGTVRRRVQKMKEDNVIDRFTVDLGPKAVKAVVMVRLSTDSEVDEILENFSRNIEVNEVTGDYDLILEFERESNEEINQVLDGIREISGVEDTKTYTVLKQRKL